MPPCRESAAPVGRCPRSRGIGRPAPGCEAGCRLERGRRLAKRVMPTPRARLRCAVGKDGARARPRATARGRIAIRARAPWDGLTGAAPGRSGRQRPGSLAPFPGRLASNVRGDAWDVRTYVRPGAGPCRKGEGSMKTPRLLLLVIASSLAACSGRSRSNSSTSARSNPLSSNGVNATLRVQSDWKAGYCADVTLENTSAAAVTWWTVVVDLHQSTLTDLWNGTVSTSGSQITVTPTGGTATIAAGGSLNALGVCGGAAG